MASAPSIAPTHNFHTTPLHSPHPSPSFSVLVDQVRKELKNAIGPGSIMNFADFWKVKHHQQNRKEMVTDFHRKLLQITQSLKHFILTQWEFTDTRLFMLTVNCSVHTMAVLYRECHCHFHMPRSLWSFGMCRILLWMFYDSFCYFLRSGLLQSWKYWERDGTRLNKLVRKPSSVLDCRMDSVEEVIIMLILLYSILLHSLCIIIIRGLV